MKNEVVNMDVTEVDVAFVKPRDGLIGFASVVLDDQLYLSGIAIHTQTGRPRLPIDLSNAEGWRGPVQPVPPHSEAGRARD